MSSISAKIMDRISVGIKKFQPILAEAKSRDVNESNTVIIITDMLSEIFGYNKYTEITSEHAIKGTYVDLAIKLDTELKLLIEAKAIGLNLKESFVKQAVDYATNQGVDWVILTNGEVWQLYKVIFSKPIEQELVIEINIMNINYKKKDDCEVLFMFTKEGWQKSAINEFHAQRQAMSRFTLAAVILTDTITESIKRELKRISPEVKIETEQIKNVLRNEVLKRDVIEGEKSDEAQKRVNKASNKLLRKPTVEKKIVKSSDSTENNSITEQQNEN